MQTPHDASIKGTFDTLQIIDDIYIPTSKWNTTNVLEPITNSYPNFGPGGATQAITQREIKLSTIEKLPKIGVR